MNDTIKELLCFLDDKADKIQEHDYMKGCDILKIMYDENKEITRSILEMQKHVLIISTRILEIERKIDRVTRQVSMNESILNDSNKRMLDMALALDMVCSWCCLHQRYEQELESRRIHWDIFKGKNDWNF
jgi:hypothetical protein